MRDMVECGCDNVAREWNTERQRKYKAKLKQSRHDSDAESELR